jgi:hypothetical protein
MAASGPIETKTASGAAVGVVVGAVTWALVAFVPAFKSGLPAPLATFLAWIVPVTLGAAASWAARHTPRSDEVLAEALKLLQEAGVTVPKA